MIRTNQNKVNHCKKHAIIKGGISFERKQKKNQKEKRILIGALCVAAVIAAGSTFAWFTSQDEVTNRLTASADYGVSLTEDFTPPDDWLPGQTVNKDVSAVNTGNISAFVKLELSGSFNLTVETASGVAITDDLVIDNNMDVLKTDDEANEVKSLQAGGYLAYAPANVATGNVGTDFTATADGLYLFRREIKSEDGKETTYDYSGYYKYEDNYYGLQTVVGEDGKLTADVIQNAGAELTDEQIGSVKLRSYENKTVNAGDEQLTWDYSKVSENLVVVTYHPSDAADTLRDIKINIGLANISDGTKADTWQYIGSNAKGAFYYTDDVEPGETTNKLVDSVTLDEKTVAAFRTMDFDLTIKLDSVQVTKSEAGNETAEAADQIGVEGNPTVDENGEITIIKWE